VQNDHLAPSDQRRPRRVGPSAGTPLTKITEGCSDATQPPLLVFPSSVGGFRHLLVFTGDSFQALPVPRIGCRYSPAAGALGLLLQMVAIVFHTALLNSGTLTSV
jgi:hypothetical protein